MIYLARSILILFGISLVNTAWSHGGKDAAPGIIDPISLHHAHIENEQKLTLSFMEDFRGETGNQRSGFLHHLELAYVWDEDNRWGTEIEIPFSNTGLDQDDPGLGDIKLQLVKYAFIKKSNRFLTGVLAFKLPTGDEAKGLGHDATEAEVAVLYDHAISNLYIGINAEYGRTVSGEKESERELGLAMGYTFQRRSSVERGNQQWVPIAALELIQEEVLSGAEKGEKSTTIIPNFQIYHPRSGWTWRFGVELPVSDDKTFDRRLIVQVGNHLDWGKIF